MLGYNIRDVNYRFSALAVNFGTQPFKSHIIFFQEKFSYKDAASRWNNIYRKGFIIFRTGKN